MAKYDLSTATLGELLADPDVAAILEKHAPGVTSNPMIAMALALPAGQAVALAGGFVGPDAVEAITREVEAL